MTSADVLPDSLRRLIVNGHLSKMVSDTESGPCLLFLRHSDRPQLPPNSAGAKVALTPNGFMRARQLGVCLKELGINSGAALICSPVTRNIQTLNEICSGADWTDHLQRIELSKAVAGLGTIYDANANVEEVVASFQQGSVHEVFNEVANGGEKRFHGIKSFEEGARGMSSLVVSVLERPTHSEIRGLSIMVSHDLHVAVFLKKFFKFGEFTAETWPPFLDSILFQLAKRDGGNRLIAVYGDQKIEIVL